MDSRAVALERVIVHPDSWIELSGSDRTTYRAAAQGMGVVLELRPIGGNPEAVVLITDAGLKVAPDFLGTVLCGRPPWEHSLREVLNVPDPCFPT